MLIMVASLALTGTAIWGSYLMTGALQKIEYVAAPTLLEIVSFPYFPKKAQPFPVWLCFLSTYCMNSHSPIYKYSTVMLRMSKSSPSKVQSN